MRTSGQSCRLGRRAIRYVVSGFEPWYRSVLSVVFIVLFVTEATGSAFITATTHNVVTVNPSADQFPQYLRNSSGTYSSATSLGSQTSEVNITVGKMVAFNSGNTFNDWTLLNSSIHVYAAPVFAGSVTYNGSNGDEAGTSVTAINITTDGATGVNAVVIGAPYANLHASDASCGQVNSGAVFIFFGHTPLNASYNLNQANLTICGNETGMLFGWSVAGVVNMTGPGGVGIAIGSPGFTYCVGATTNLGTTSCSPTNAPHAGAVWAVDRAVLKTIYTNLKWKPGMHAVTDIGSVYASFLADLGAYSVLKGEELGYSVGAIENTTSAGVAHPGYDDILAGAPYLNDTKGKGVGEAYAWDLPSGSVVGFENPSNRTNSHYGWSVGNVSDPGGANRQDVVIGAPGSDTVYVYKGDYWSSKYGVYTGGTTIAEPVLYRIPGRPGTNFGWSVTGINRPPSGGSPQIAVGSPTWSTRAATTASLNTVTEFTASGSSLATANPSGNLYVYQSGVAPAALNLTAASTYSTDPSTWTADSWSGTTVCTITYDVASPSPYAGAKTTEFSGTKCSGWLYVTPASVPTRADMQAYVDMTTGSCLGISGYDVSVTGHTTNFYPEATATLYGGGVLYIAHSSGSVNSYQYPEQNFPTVDSHWYKLDLVFDNTNEQYDVYVNNILVVSNVSYLNAGTTEPTINSYWIGAGDCYGNANTVTGYIGGFRVLTYTKSTTATYTSTFTTTSSAITNATVAINASYFPHSYLSVFVTANGGTTWQPVPYPGGNVSFLGGDAGTSFGFKATLRTNDERYTPILYGAVLNKWSYRPSSFVSRLSGVTSHIRYFTRFFFRNSVMVATSVPLTRKIPRSYLTDGMRSRTPFRL